MSMPPRGAVRWERVGTTLLEDLDISFKFLRVVPGAA